MQHNVGAESNREKFRKRAVILCESPGRMSEFVTMRQHVCGAHALARSA